MSLTTSTHRVDVRTPTANTMSRIDLFWAGSLDAEASLELRERIIPHLIDGPRLFLLDVSGIDHVTASGIVGAVELLRLARRHGGDLRLFGVSAAFEDATLQTQLSAIARCYVTREQAIAGPIDRVLPTKSKRSRSWRPRRRAGR